MQICDTIAGMRQAIRDLRALDRPSTLGLVPTMGALHAGHLSLVARARRENSLVAASIFVNPLQFGPNEDLAKYPRTFADDCAQLERAGVDLLFAPTPDEMYAKSATTMVDPGPVATRLDGVSRPGHFVGVATVVAKLFHIIQCDRAYFGQKDAAQLAVLRQMARDLNFPLELIACPIVRDGDGLALSSRNRYLTAEERAQALVLPRTLDALAQCIAAGERDAATLIAAGHAVLRHQPAAVLDYLVFVDPDTLLPVSEAATGSLVAIAAKVGTTRLIDNFLVA
ncbi:MAG TPA: pantoate--beta-alanine ligase [Granulicella sp.]|nr:pantoate--beta-alanine ligase [Granulicella sp.]